MSIFKRKRTGKTNYGKRLEILKSRLPRLVIRKSLSNMLVQAVNYEKDGDKVVTSAHSVELKKLGWSYPTGNIPSAYLTGLLLGKKAEKFGIKEMTADLGMQRSTKGSRLYAALKGVSDAGIKVNYSKEVIPDESRLKGKHISNHQKENKNYDYSNIDKSLEDLKKKIMGK